MEDESLLIVKSIAAIYLFSKGPFGSVPFL